MTPTPETARTWLDLVERYGLPLVFLLVIVVALGFVLYAIWLTLKPHLDKFIVRHIDLMDTTRACLVTLTNSVTESKDCHVETHQKIDELAAAIRDGDKLCRETTAEAHRESREDIKTFYADSRAERKEDRAEHSSNWSSLRDALNRLGNSIQGKPRDA